MSEQPIQRLQDETLAEAVRRENEPSDQKCPDCGLHMVMEMKYGLVNEITHRCYHCEDEDGTD